MPAVSDGSRVEGADCLLVWCRKGDVRSGRRSVLPGDPEEGLASVPIACDLITIIEEPLNP
jgi:hypothetical protein